MLLLILRRRATGAAILTLNHRLPLSTLSTTTTPLTSPQLKTLVLSHCRLGKFSNLFNTVVASPSVLLTACHNLTALNPKPNHVPAPPTIDSISTNFFSIHVLAQQLRTFRFDFKSCIVKMPPPSGESSSDSLVLPNLKLKVVIEAIRMVLEVVYDDYFVTFSYGGRVGMGRHTAIRYLKNNVVNPSWCLNVGFNRMKFDDKHLNKLCLIIKEKINDDALIDVIKRLFELDVVRIELGGCCLGRGFPRECGLSSILINVYFNGFDKKIQEMRLLWNRENLKLKHNDLVVNHGSVLYKPSKLYAIRYLDEILLMTSGTKYVIMGLKKQVLEMLEKDLELDVDREKTVIHSAVSEKINFLGMGIQAVPPSVLRPPMSEKAIRARKKYLRQKEVRLLEMRNAKETNRKKLGMKIFGHVYKKLKQSNGLKFDFHVENEVREIFRSWSDEVMEEFLGSIEERTNWHRKLSSGDFLSLRRIRDQLPEELVDSYDEFQEQVDKYLNPVKSIKELEEKERRVKEEEERRYAERTVEDLSKLCIKIVAPEELIKKTIRMAGFTNNMGRPRPITSLMVLEDSDIIKWYAGVGRRWLDFFCCSHNLRFVKTVVNYHLRYSCILTLAEKHESTKREAIKHYTKDLKVFDVNGRDEVHFPTEREIKMMGDNNLSDPKPVDGALTMSLIRLALYEPMNRCAAHFCHHRDATVYRIRLLQKDLNLNPLDEKKWVSGMGAIHESFNQTCVPLCSDHISEFYIGKLTLQDIDYSSVVM